MWQEKGNNTYSFSECEKLAQKEYKRRHDRVARIVWKLCGRYNLKRSEKWCQHAPEGVLKMKK